MTYIIYYFIGKRVIFNFQFSIFNLKSLTFAPPNPHFNMKHPIRSYTLWALCLLLTMASCRSSKHTADSVSPALPVETLPEAQPSASSLTAETNLCAKVKASVSLGGKTLGTGGNLRMRIGDVIQLSLHDPLLGITEIGRLEISPDGILLIDRYNKQYVTVSYDEINARTGQNLTYQEIEYHFWQQALRTDTDELTYQIPTGQQKDIRLRFRLSGKNNQADWESHTTPSGKYEQVSAEQLFKSIVQ